MTKSQALPPAGSESTPSSKQILVYTTFVEAESHSFRELVQKLTGVTDDSEEEKLPVTVPARNSKKDGSVPGNKSGGSCYALMKSGIEVGSQKSAFKLHHRRKFQKRLEIRPGHCNHTTLLSGSKKYLISPTLIPSPITPLVLADPFTCYNNCSPSGFSTSPSCNQSPCLAEEEGFCFQGSPIGVKREPELLPLFPLQSPTQPRST